MLDPSLSLRMTKALGPLRSALPVLVHQLLERLAARAQFLEGNVDERPFDSVRHVVHVRRSLVDVEQTGDNLAALLVRSDVRVRGVAVCGVVVARDLAEAD